MSSKTELIKRQNKYFQLNSLLSSIPNTQLIASLRKNRLKSGWGKNFAIKLNGTNIFVKSIPLTQKEYDKSFSTRNIFKLPDFYNYGVGSAGFGAYRALIGQVKASNWALEGSCTGFPILYHYRVVPRFSGAQKLNRKSHREYIEYWNSNRNIENYIQERRNSAFEIILFLEHFPDVLKNRLTIASRDLESIADQMAVIIEFLESNNVIHFDAHLANILADGKNVYLTDFGLVRDKSYELTKKEENFFDAHKGYDWAEFISCCGLLVHEKYVNLPRIEKNKINKALEIDSENYAVISKQILRDIDYSHKYLKFPKRFYEFSKTHQELMISFTEFILALTSDPKKKARFSDFSL